MGMWGPLLEGSEQLTRLVSMINLNKDRKVGVTLADEHLRAICLSLADLSPCANVSNHLVISCL